MKPAPVRFSPVDITASLQWSLSDELLDVAQKCGGKTQPVIDVLYADPTRPPTPASTGVLALWEFQASVAAQDLSAARALEPHLDAAAILEQAGIDFPTGSYWGVYAAEHPDHRLEARAHKDHFVLSGVKPWCSLAQEVSHAIITAHTPAGRRAFAVNVTDERLHGRIKVSHGAWVSRGLADVSSGPVSFDSVPAIPVGEPKWYLNRPGFALGGVGVAAIWFGGAVGLYRHLLASAQKRTPDPLATAWLGETERLLAGAGAHLYTAALLAEQNGLGWEEALRVRGNVAAVCERILSISGHSTGPGPLTMDADHARRCADLTVYIRQHHAARDDAALGEIVLNNNGKEAGGSQ